MAKLVGRDDSVVESLDESLETLQPEEQFVDVDGHRIYVKPYTFKKLFSALKHISNIQEMLLGDAEFLEQNLLQAIAEHGDDILQLISLATDIPVEEFDDIPSDKGLDLAIMTYKVNESFFVKNLKPKLEELGLFDSQNQQEEETPEEAPKAKSKKIGSTSSKS